jgi:hypothetical protein
MDMEASQGQIQGLRLVFLISAFARGLTLCRNLFDRVLTQKMTSHKAKYVRTYFGSPFIQYLCQGLLQKVAGA